MILFIFLGSVFLNEPLLSQSIEADLEKGFSNADPELIVKHLDTNAKIIIKSDSYSPNRQEASKILADFFKRYPVTKYEDKFKSSKSTSNFLIILLKTNEKSFRVTIFFKSATDDRKINLLRIEQENE
jgi:hypothetical protein